MNEVWIDEDDKDKGPLPLWFILINHIQWPKPWIIDQNQSLYIDIIKNLSISEIIRLNNAHGNFRLLDELFNRTINIPLHPSVFKSPNREYNLGQYYYRILENTFSNQIYEEKKDTVKLIKLYLNIKPSFHHYKLNSEEEEDLIWYEMYFNDFHYMRQLYGYTDDNDDDIMNKVEYIIEEGVDIEEVLVKLINTYQDKKNLLYYFLNKYNTVNITNLYNIVLKYHYDKDLWDEIILNQV